MIKLPDGGYSPKILKGLRSELLFWFHFLISLLLFHYMSLFKFNESTRFFYLQKESNNKNNWKLGMVFKTLVPQLLKSKRSQQSLVVRYSLIRL